MNNQISFIKMHGLGNDFVMIKESSLKHVKDMKNFVINISDRKIGVGCDQFITYTKHEDHVLMNIFNQDGSKAKACGNASRCLSRTMFDEYGLKDIVIKVDDREIAATYSDPQNSTVNMGRANFDASWMPKQEDLWQLAAKYHIEPKEVLCVDVGNPHFVIFTKLSDSDKRIIGENLQKHELFPVGVNVNFASIDDDFINLKVWERGAGFTLACGSGASASFAAANKLGFVDDEATVKFKLGSLKMSKKNEQILMSGPASYVFAGEYVYE
jgi:diaminopimelate epimerase